MVDKVTDDELEFIAWCEGGKLQADDKIVEIPRSVVENLMFIAFRDGAKYANSIYGTDWKTEADGVNDMERKFTDTMTRIFKGYQRPLFYVSEKLSEQLRLPGYFENT